MKNRSLYSVLTRFGIVGAVLTAVLLIGSVASAQGVNSDAHEYAENDTVPVGTYSAVDPEGKDVKYGVSNEDDFAITEDGGVLTFNDPPDYETTPDHKYTVTVTANDADLIEVTITITNMEEGAVVTVEPPRPQIGKAVTASVKDEDGGEDDEMWTWARSSDMMEWTPIDDATSFSYTPKSADDEMYLRATVSYIDDATSEDDASTADVDESRDTASGVSEKKVEANPNANEAPEFAPDVDSDDADEIPDIYRITIKENAKGAIGEDPIVATDADNDVLLYSLTEEAPRTVVDNQDANPRFEIDKRSGRISVTAGTVLNFLDDADITNGNNAASYDVTVTATDPSGAPGTVMVNIVVEDVDEKPVIADTNATAASMGEDGDDEDTIPQTVLAATAPENANLTYTATDEDAADEGINWSLSGPDKGSFGINESGELSFNDSDTEGYVAPDYETKKEYKITIEAVGDRTDPVVSTVKDTLDVTVTLTNVDEGGMVMMTARQPQVGKPVTASVMDPDGDISELMWQWASVVSGAPDEPNAACPEADDGGWTAIEGATTASYTPKADDATNCLRATASYEDGAEAALTERTPAMGVSDRAVEVKPFANDAPVFADEDEPTGADPVELEVYENTTGDIADAIITAIDPNGDLMMYSLEGGDADSFSIGRITGQLSVGDGTKLDYESDKKTYSFMVKATDPSGANNTVPVTITLLDEDEAPVAAEGVTNPEEVDYAENDDVAVGTYSAVDPEGKDVKYGVSNEDDFAITEDGGVLTFNDPPDYETTPDHKYTVTVTANDADLIEVTITITNMEEGAVVTVEPPRPQIGKAATASVKDEDGGEDDHMWTWARSSDMMEWTAIDEATQSSYTPKSADDEMYLRATVSYIDDATSEDDASTADVDESRDTASGVSEKTVEANPDANEAPEFAPDVDSDDADEIPDIYRITIKENAKGAIGEDPIVATDADNDVLLYSLTEEAPRTVVDNQDANPRFEIDKRSGQISVTAGTVLNFLDDADITNGNNAASYDVTVTATDPSGAPGTVMVNIVVEDVDEKPVIADTNATAASMGEDGDDEDTIPQTVLAATAPENANLTYTATDEDAADEGINWSLSGPDKGSFGINESGELSFNDSDTEGYVAPDYETKKEYKITIEAVGDRTDPVVSTVKDTLDVTVTLTNVDEGGMVMMTARQPQVGKPVTASVMDPDGDISELMWQWASVVSGAPDEPNAACPEADDGGWTAIEGATTASYTPKADDATNCLRATASYEDGAEAALTERTPAMGVSDRAVEVKPFANDAPVFADEDEPTGADPVELEVYEKTTGDIADAIMATDPNGDLMMYSLEGGDADSFSIGRITGQLSVGDGTKLDYESDKKTYSFMVKATDPSGADGTVDVTITLKDVDEGPELNSAPEFDAETAERSVAENTAAGEDIGDPITATDENTGDSLTYSLGGDDAASFAIDADTGQLMTEAALDHEAMDSHTVTVTATDTGRLYAMITVTIMVTDVNEAPTFDAETDDRDVDENTEAAMEIGDPVAAMDMDADDTLTYSLDAAGDMSFDIDSATGQLMTEAALDYESGTTSYSVTVTATDSDGLYAMIAVTIAVGDMNEAPVFASAMVMISVDENTPAGTELGPPITATDEDAGATLVYSLGGDDAASFAIDAATGQLMTMAELDHETKGSYTLTVMVTDGVHSAEITVMVTVDVDNVNEAPVFGEGDSTDRHVDENTEAGMAIGDPVTATDEDAGDTLEYSLGGDDAASFAIDAATGQLMTSAALDYEMTTSYSVTVTATDSGGLYAMIAVTIAVNDVLETPVFDADAIEFPVDENMPVGTAVGTVTALHAESYSDDLDYFNVDGMGNITTTMMFDYEGADTSFTGTVTATGADGSTDTIAVTVTVGDAHPGCTMADNMGLTNDCEALLDAKGDLGGDLNWDTDTAMADWEGVTMSDGRVSEVWLKDEGLDGSVSAAFGRLDMLTLLNLHTNMLTGSIPDLSGASMLEELYLPNNMLDGEIPAWLNDSTNLTNLWLWGNQLTGGIPDLSGLTNLDMLKLANNDLSGEINAMYLPQNVSWLIIDRNGFSGSIPDLSGLTSLKLLWLHTNELTGDIPNGTMLPAGLDDLNLRDNMLTGAIPDLSALDNLTRLRLHNNSLSGAVPGSLGGLDSLEQLWLHNEVDKGLGNNMFTSIDDGVGGLSDTLIEIELGGNPWADDACVPAALAGVEKNDYEAAGIDVCGADDGS